MTQTTQCGFCRETYEVEDQTYTPDAQATPLNQCATCARREACGGPERDYPMFDRQPDNRIELADWRPDDRVELTAWQPDDLVWLASRA
jgi:ubiquitin